MKIMFFGTKSYDKKYFNELLPEYTGVEVTYIEHNLMADTVKLAEGSDAVCAFVNADISTGIVEKLHSYGIKLILMRCAGYNNVDIDKAREVGIKVLRVPSYSPEAVAELAMALALTANRKTHKAYARLKENDFSLSGLIGVNLYKKTAGIVGTGKIGKAMAKICKGFGMNLLFYDIYEDLELKNTGSYVSFDTLLKESDLISLHCPLNESNYHMINEETINKMKKGILLINTSRGGLINTEDLIRGIREGKFGAVGLDVYEEENPFVFEDRSEQILESSVVATLLSFPHVMVTSHQGFFTEEAMRGISFTTLENVRAFMEGKELVNECV